MKAMLTPLTQQILIGTGLALLVVVLIIVLVQPWRSRSCAAKAEPSPEAQPVAEKHVTVDESQNQVHDIPLPPELDGALRRTADTVSDALPPPSPPPSPASPLAPFDAMGTSKEQALAAQAAHRAQLRRPTQRGGKAPPTTGEVLMRRTHESRRNNRDHGTANFDFMRGRTASPPM